MITGLNFHWSLGINEIKKKPLILIIWKKMRLARRWSEQSPKKSTVPVFWGATRYVKVGWEYILCTKWALQTSLMNYWSRDAYFFLLW